MKKTKTIAGCTVLLALAAGSAWYWKDHRRTEILRTTNGDHTLIIRMIGDPVFPFGEVHCEALLKHGIRTEDRVDFTMQNDGKVPAEEQFSVVWSSASAALTVYAEESEAVVYVLHAE